MAGYSQTIHQSGSRSSLTLLAVPALLIIGLGIRWLYIRAVVFPPLDDPAFYLITAQNLVAGRGLEVDALWSYQIPFPQVTHPSHEHWMPLTTGLIAAAFSIQRLLSGELEGPLRTGQIPGLVMGTLLVLFTYTFGRRALSGSVRNCWAAWGAAVLVAINATLSYQSASADSSAPFALLAAWVLATAIRSPGEQGGYFGTGLLIALAYLTRPDGLLLLLAVPLAWGILPKPTCPPPDLPDKPEAKWAWEHWPREEGAGNARRCKVQPSLASLVDMGVGFVLLVAPWLVRNYLAFGTPLPSSVLSQAWLTDYGDTFSYLSHPTWQSWLAQGWTAILAQRTQALLHNGRVFLVSTFPWGLLALPGLWLLRRERAFFPAFVYTLILYLVTALVFPISSMSGTFYHSLGAVMPFLALAAVHTVQMAALRFCQVPRLAGIAGAAVAAGIVISSGAQVALSLPAVAARHQLEREQFEYVTGWLTQHATPGDVVMTTQPYTLNYASGHPCIVLPANEPPEAAWQAAQHYGARFLVITQGLGQYPTILHDRPDPRFRLLVATHTTKIYAIQGETP